MPNKPVRAAAEGMPKKSVNHNESRKPQNQKKAAGDSFSGGKTEMNMIASNAAFNDASIVRDPLAPNGPLTSSIDMAALRGLSMKELFDIRDVMHTLGDVISGFCSQPRFFMDESYSYNDAGCMLEDISSWISAYEQAAVNVAKAATPTAPQDVAKRAWTVLAFEADMCDDMCLADLAAMAAAAVRDVEVAKFDERLGRPSRPNQVSA
ncbi:hypothetical protein [Mesorhizobium sp. ZC-5]|uniref:hypothetical protein n=1 Tax=Mesorhizobium sp. ZC-5 TaxID=2986066 RepID=UPI0021E75D88|nr:hypothetical protein [Mesorhizobium sp. ZC-5]MCV3239688.1 hypothetical protein [Mesorhizobium sp. ZC-5]